MSEPCTVVVHVRCCGWLSWCAQRSWVDSLQWEQIYETWTESMPLLLFSDSVWDDDEWPEEKDTQLQWMCKSHSQCAEICEHTHCKQFDILFIFDSREICLQWRASFNNVRMSSFSRILHNWYVLVNHSMHPNYIHTLHQLHALLVECCYLDA